MSDFLNKHDYEEPQCLLNMHPEVVRIPTGRVIERLDSYLDRNDYAAAERHLHYWLAEAELGHDDRGRLTALNELVGLYRKQGEREAGLKTISDTLALLESMELDNTVTQGTALINAATGLKSFGDAGAALPLYQKAKAVYETLLAPTDERLGGLYNNMALAMMELKDFRGAEELFGKALNVMLAQKHGEAEAAITYLNMADLVTLELGQEAGEEKISAYLDKAEALLHTEDLPRDGHYAFVCEKCAPAFGYYGYFLMEQELNETARAIYERT